jgi:hypothetical protein
MIEEFSVLQAQSDLPSAAWVGDSEGGSRMTPVSAPMQETVSVDVVIRTEFGMFFVGLPMVIPSKYIEMKENLGRSDPLVSKMKKEYSGESEAETIVLTLMFAMLDELLILLAILDRGPPMNKYGG